MLVSPKSFLQTSHNYKEAHLSFKTMPILGLHGNPDMCIPHAHQEPGWSKDLRASYCYCFSSSNLSASGFSNTLQKHRTHHFFLPGLGLLSGSLWGVRKEGACGWCAGSNRCCPAELMLSNCGSTAATNSRLHTTSAQAKSKTFTASEKQTAPVAADRTDFCFL